ASLAAKGGRPSMAATGWATVAAGLAAGILAGNHLAGRVPPSRGRAAVITLAMAGAVLTVVRGVAAL
ncbi:sulfite exporter TauE/SafE family protein, partial [Actinoallomurus acaciae]